jgi:cell division protein FtsZ
VLGEDVTQVEAFAAADNVLCGAVSGIVDIIHHKGLVNVDFQDVRTVMLEQGMAMMGRLRRAASTGRASRPSRQSPVRCSKA